MIKAGDALRAFKDALEPLKGKPKRPVEHWTTGAEIFVAFLQRWEREGAAPTAWLRKFMGESAAR